MQRGFSTIELLIAFAVALMFLSAMYIVAFGDEDTILSGESNAEAIAKTQVLIESAQARGREDFNLVNATSTVDGMYTKTVSVHLLPDFLTKRIVASTTWTGKNNHLLQVAITTLVTNIDNVHSPDTCNSSISTVHNWKNPQHFDFQTINLLPAPSTNGISISDIDVLGNRLYVLADSATNPRPETFFIFDIPKSPSEAPVFRGRIDNNASSSEGLVGVALASTTNKIYAYVTNVRGSNFGTCVPGANCAQLQILDATEPVAPVVVTNYLVPTSTPPFVLGSSGQATGKSVYYKDGYLYLGLKLATSGPEFIILDVGGGGAGSATNPSYVGSYDVNFTVNAITVKGEYAYIATNETVAGNKRLLVLNVMDKTTPRLAQAPVGGFFTAGGIGVGNAVHVIGGKIYFGTAFSGSTIPNFYIINGTTPGSYPTPLPKYGLGTTAGTNDSVRSILIRDTLAFLLTNSQFQVWDVTNPALPVPWTNDGTQNAFLRLSALGSNGGITADCEGDVIYLALKSTLGAGKDIVSIITAGI